MELELINFELELKFATKKLNPQINLPLNVLIQKYFFHDNPTLNTQSEYLLGISTLNSLYSEYLLMVNSIS